jgi:poly-gamma-glutamate capsule biosynthesis protein CapA/YwtB (metallophosphatase superfamily)
MRESVKLLAFGDICLDSFSQRNFEKSDAYRALLKKTLSYEGVTLANLESPLTKCTNLNKNKIALRADRELLRELPRIDVFSLANNHISDAGPEGVEDTINALSQNKKQYFGHGHDISGARQPALIERDGMRLAFIGYSCLTTNGENYATKVKPGVCPLAPEYIEADVSRLNNEADHVIVVLHWGEEHEHYPTPDQVVVAHRAIDAGASVVIGAHPHVIQGIERYKQGFICYSLGNFIFSDLEQERMSDGRPFRYAIRLSNANKESIGAEFVFEKNKATLSSIKAYKLDEYFLPNEVHLEDLGTDVNELNEKLETYIKKKSLYLRTIPGPLLKIRFEGNKYQNRYILRPIHACHTSVRIKAFLHGLLFKYILWWK